MEAELQHEGSAPLGATACVSPTGILAAGQAASPDAARKAVAAVIESTLLEIIRTVDAEEASARHQETKDAINRFWWNNSRRFVAGSLAKHFPGVDFAVYWDTDVHSELGDIRVMRADFEIGGEPVRASIAPEFI